ncbi:sister chromatid cohesion protein PDS5 [Blastomyces dermatitidis ER-3]|uniref:Sister chromatid cohesion protein PDS5 n=1 Tax=Ajellomyces dermatitidis (strain ER-3 / ATCC MYA-2586) TaxID=559297 RepID=A0ABP2EPY8_AJEDR|nr:sister chromatid cohesion protein PDS5 [Blastomyces dermatitidis ER-3]EEQ84407.1 sister chromatid cohesion protein PDS5 [Blastomyces dermatitidis ER-3]
MPARTRHSLATTPEVAEPEEEPSGLRRLRFNDTLSWRAGRAIPVADLLERLESLALELRQLDQEETDKDSLKNVSQDLASGHLLGHRDKGVRAWTACCVVDILRLCAPNAPFTGNQLKDIFTTIVTSIIPALADPSNAYNEQHVYVLSSLADVKSIVLLTDLDAPDTLILPLFSSCFDIVSGSSKSSTGEELAKNVEYDMTRLLAPIIDESSVLAPEIIDVIIAQFLRVDPRIVEHSTSSKSKKNSVHIDSKQGTLLLKEYPPAYNMAKAICNACPEKMTSYVSQYFNNVIIDASGPSGANGLSKAHRRASIDDSDDEAENIKELSKAHRLIREVWRACPDVLQNVIPQLEAELSAESVSLRLLATQTIGDVTAGIGVAGPPTPPTMDPAAYPPARLTDDSQITQPNALLLPLAPKPFSQAHSTAYQSFLSRRQDKSASVRAAWVTGIGRIILTSAGGSGLSTNEEQDLVHSLAKMLGDADERVRIAAVEVIGTFGFSDTVKKLGISGGISDQGSVLSVLAERVKDRKHAVREHAMKILARMWGVASGEIEVGNEQVTMILKDIPSRILDAYYTNNLDIQVLLDHVIFELLLPLNYPPLKSKAVKGDSSQLRKLKSAMREGEGYTETDIEMIRVRRILTLVKGLDERAKKVFFALQARQLSMRTFMTFYLTACEEYNGGVMDSDEETTKSKLTKVIDNLAKMLPDQAKVSADLWKFAKMHDRRSYQLIRFAMAAVSDYRTVTKAIRELSKRIQGNTSVSTSLLESLTPLVYRSSSLIFNRSHIPAIMDVARSDELGLGNTAHEMLREVSSQNPEVLEAHVQDMCKDLESHAPSAKQSDEAGVEEILKACAGFAKKLPTKLPTERKFLIALTNYALYSSSPKAAKHAVSIIMATSDKKQMYAKDLIKQSVQNCTYNSQYFLTKLATISQINLLAPEIADEEGDAIISIATDDILLNNRTSNPSAGYAWSDDIDNETAAKEWALRVLVNRVRAKQSTEDEESFRSYAEPVYKILNTLVANDGELSKKQNSPATQKSRLRLLAAKLIIKLSSAHAICEKMVTPKDFNAVALVAQDQLEPVRSSFIGQLKKKLTQTTHLGTRWYTVTFLLAFEPNRNLKDSTLTWLRSRTHFFIRLSQNNDKGSEQTVMESLAARLLSLLAYHPDYPPESSDESTKVDDLADFARYILFYLSAVANENNLSLIFHIMQRVKQVRDAITGSAMMSTRLYTLSDLAQATTRRFAELYSQQHKIGGSGGSGAANILQTYPGKMRLPSSLFTTIPIHSEALSIAEKNYLAEEVDDKLDRIVRLFMKPRTQSASNGPSQTRKRKVDLSSMGKTSGAGAKFSSFSSKKARRDSKEKSLPIRKSSLAEAGVKPAKRRKTSDEDDWEGGGGRLGEAESKARRRSGRGTKAGISYAEGDSDEDDMEMVEWEEEQNKAEEEGNNSDESEEDGSGERESSEAEEEAEEAEEGGQKEGEKEDQNNATPSSLSGDDDEGEPMEDAQKSLPLPPSRSKRQTPRKKQLQQDKPSSPVAATRGRGRGRGKPPGKRRTSNTETESPDQKQPAAAAVEAGPIRRSTRRAR